MAILDRLFFLIYALAILALAGGILVLCTGFVPFDFVWTNFVYLSGRWETVAVAAVFLLLSLRLLKISLTPEKRAKRQKEAVVVHGKMGDIQVAVEAIRNMVDKTARSVRCIRDVKVQVVALEAQPKTENEAAQQVKVIIKAIIGQEGNVINISDQVRSLVKENLVGIVGLNEFEVEVLIDDISNAPLQKQRVV